MYICTIYSLEHAFTTLPTRIHALSQPPPPLQRLATTLSTLPAMSHHTWTYAFTLRRVEALGSVFIFLAPSVVREHIL